MISAEITTAEITTAEITTADTPATRLATRLGFFVAGFGIACWAPLVPFAKARTGADEASLGMLLLCLGVGSVAAMPLAGGLAGRIGSRAVILLGGVGIAISLPVLAIASWTPLLVVALLVFGASIGAMDVAVNIHGCEVQDAAGTTLMSNFHGMYSVGGLIGSAAMTSALALKTPPMMAAGVSSAIITFCLLIAGPRLLRTKSHGDTPFLVRPRGIVLLIGLLAFAMFLVEGAMLDWSAVFLTENRGLPARQAGIGYVLFSLAMTIGRLSGDKITRVLGGQRILVYGSILTSLGIAFLILAPWPAAGLFAFVLVGFGAANLVPVLFTAAGSQKQMPADLAIAAVSVLGYLGVLMGPAAIGFIGKSIGLTGAFALLAVLSLSVAVLSRVGRGQDRSYH